MLNAGGVQDLEARSHRPHSSPNRKVFDEQEQLILHLRRERKLGIKMLRNELARQHGLKLALDTIHKVLVRHGENQLRRPRLKRKGTRCYSRPVLGDRVQMDTVRYGPLESLWQGTQRTWEMSVFTLRMLGRMVTGELSLRNLSGPVTIADLAGQSARVGWFAYLNFLALISISLGVLNLLPIPLLDGGHLMYYAIEIVKGSPVSERAMELGQRVGLALLIVMMAFAFYNDLNRLLTG